MSVKPGPRQIAVEQDQEIASCILGATGGATGIHQNSAIINEKTIIIAIGPYMVCLGVPSLELIWKTMVDSATCFGVYNSDANRCYLSHGEMEVARVSYAGRVEWSNGGADILTNEFSFTEQLVSVVDFYERKYTWDIITGNAITGT